MFGLVWLGYGLLVLADGYPIILGVDSFSILSTIVLVEGKCGASP